MFSSLGNKGDLEMPPPKKKKGKKKSEKKEESKTPNLNDKSICTVLKNKHSRFGCYITTDKDKYKPGETCHVRATFLNTFTHRPGLKILKNEGFMFAITGPDGCITYGGPNVTCPAPENSTISLDWKIPKNQKGGSYEISIDQLNYESLDLSEKLETVDKDPKVEVEPAPKYTIDANSKRYLRTAGNSITRIGSSGWNAIVRVPVTKDVQKFTFKIDRTANDKSGLFIGLGGNNITAGGIWSLASTATSSGGIQQWNSPIIPPSGYLQQGDIYEFTIDKIKDTVSIKRNGKFYGVNSKKVSSFQKPISMCICLYYPNNQVTLMTSGIQPFVSNGKRKFDIIQYTPPKFKMELMFLKKAFGINDLCKARLKVERSEGGFPQKGFVEANAKVDGKEIFSKKIQINPKNGIVMIVFKLPSKIESGMGKLSCAVTEGTTENVSKSIPIILKKIDCKLYPEGGKLIRNCLNALYFQAKTLYGDPADFKGILMSKKGDNEVLVKGIQTLHEGRGMFEFIPETGKDYYIKVLDPSGVTTPIDITGIHESGLTMSLINKKALKFGTPFSVILSSTETTQIKYTLCKKEKIIQVSDVITIKKGEKKSIKMDPKDVDGVVRVTVYFCNTIFGVNNLEFPICERLLFINPKDELKYVISTDRTEYSPGDKVKLTVKSTLKSTKLPQQSFCSVTVSDDSTISTIERRNRMPLLKEMVYLEDEVLTLKDSEAYFNKINDGTNENVEPEVATDLLLGIQGWRRFIYKFFKKDQKFYEKDQKDIFKDINVDNIFKVLSIPNPCTSKPMQILQDIIIEDKEIDFGVDFEKDGGNYEDSDECDDDDFDTGMIVDQEEVNFSIPEPMVERSKSEAPKPQMKLLSRAKIQNGKSFSRSMPKPSPMKMDESELLMDIPVMSPPSRPAPSNFNGFGFFSRSSSSKVRVKSEKKKMDISDRKEVIRLDKIKKTLAPAKQLTYVREYAHQNDVQKKGNVRNDFTETIYFNSVALLKKNERNEFVKTFEFNLSDSITSFRVLVNGFTTNGIVGSDKTFQIISKKAFYIEPKLPIEIGFMDDLKIPVAIINNLKSKQKCIVNVTSDKALKITSPKDSKWKGEIQKEDRIVKYFGLKVTDSGTFKESKFNVKGELTELQMKDEITKVITVKPYGFPTYFQFSGNLKAKEKKQWKMKIPKSFVKGSLECLGFVSPSSLSQFTKGLSGMIREPYGCFEQVSSTMYPMIMAVQFMNENEDSLDTNLLNKIEKHLKSGYDKLRGYEIKSGGFDWYGNPPANESLSAMGLIQFIELKEVHPVNENIIKRTMKWLLERKEEKGFKRNNGRYAYGHAPSSTTDSYILWALSKVGDVQYNDVKSIIEHVEKEVKSNRKLDCYVAALLSLCLFNYGKEKESKELVKMFIGLQKPDGSFDEAKSTITRSGGNNKTLEVTALVALAFYNFEKEFESLAVKCVDYILKNNQNGCYGSTQATVLCIKAVKRYLHGVGEGAGKIELNINGTTVSTVAVYKNSSKAIDFDDFLRHVRLDKENVFEIVSKLPKPIPFSINIACKIGTPSNAQKKLPFTFNAKLTAAKVKEGGSTEVEVTIKNKLDKPLPMMCCIVALPSGVDPRLKKLKELQEMEKFHYFELWGARNVVFYWYGMKKNQTINFKMDVTARIPGVSLGDCSRCYLYYNNTVKFWIKGMKINILENK